MHKGIERRRSNTEEPRESSINGARTLGGRSDQMSSKCRVSVSGCKMLTSPSITTCLKVSTPTSLLRESTSPSARVPLPSNTCMTACWGLRRSTWNNLSHARPGLRILVSSFLSRHNSYDQAQKQSGRRLQNKLHHRHAMEVYIESFRSFHFQACEA